MHRYSQHCVRTIKNSSRDDGRTIRDKGVELEIVKSDGM